jgi:hypothetical protein
MKTHTEVPLVKTGVMIDAATLKAKDACHTGYKAFCERFKETAADYQEVLHWLAEIEKPDWAHWLIGAMGKTQTVVKIEGNLAVTYCFVAGSISVSGRIEAGEGIKAGRGIEAGEGIEAGWIDCALRIFAGLISCRLPTEAELTIKAEIRRGTVAHGKLIV